MASPSDDPRTGEMDLLWDTESGGKTQEAIKALATLLTKIGADSVVTDDEVRELQAWKVKHRSVIGREALRPFRDWLDKVLADGEVDAEERIDLLAWCQWAKAWSEKRKASMPVPVPRSSPTIQSITISRDWKTDPMSDRQRSFLHDLGASSSQMRGLTKGQASNLIDQLLEQRDSRPARPAVGGCSPVMIIAAVVVVLIIIGIMSH